jgi:hypothetical protein
LFHTLPVAKSTRQAGLQVSATCYSDGTEQNWLGLRDLGQQIASDHLTHVAAQCDNCLQCKSLCAQTTYKGAKNAAIYPANIKRAVIYCLAMLDEDNEGTETRRIMTFGRGFSQKLVVAMLPLFGLGFNVTAPRICSAQARGSTTQGMFGTSQVGNPAGASASGTGSGMTMGQGSTNSSAQVPGNTSSSMGNSLGLGANMQNFTPGGATGFVGANSQSATNLMSRAGTQGAVQAGRVNFGSLTNLMNQSRQNQFNQQQAQKAARTASQPQGQFRVPLRVGFQMANSSSMGTGAAISQRMVKMPGLSQAGRITASLEGQTAVLRGTVPSEGDRQLAEALAQLEPGVITVRNELVVGSTPSQPAEPLPPAISAP